MNCSPIPFDWIKSTPSTTALQFGWEQWSDESASCSPAAERWTKWVILANAGIFLRSTPSFASLRWWTKIWHIHFLRFWALARKSARKQAGLPNSIHLRTYADECSERTGLWNSVHLRTCMGKRAIKQLVGESASSIYPSRRAINQMSNSCKSWDISQKHTIICIPEMIGQRYGTSIFLTHPNPCIGSHWGWIWALRGCEVLEKKTMDMLLTTV